MEKLRLDVFEQKLKEANQNYLKVKDSKDKECDKLEEFKKIIDKCNILEAYNLDYLRLLKSFEDENSFKLDLQKYECSLSSTSINENFPKVIHKIKAINKIEALMKSILKLGTLSVKNQEIELKKIFEQIKSEKVYRLNCQLLPSDNIELYLNILYNVFGKCISEKINEFVINNLELYENEEDKESDKKMLHEISNLINKYKEIEDNKEKEKEKKELNKNISAKMEVYRIFQIVHNNQFQDYLKGFLDFYNNLSSYLYKNFFNNENFNDNDVKLFEQFIHMVSNFDFQDLDDDYISLWKESFEEIPIKNKEDILKNLNKTLKGILNFSLVNANKDIQMKYKESIFTIKNIYKYSFNRLMFYLSYRTKRREISEFELIKFLKIQCFSDYIHENILNTKWKSFLYNIFNSETILSLIKSVYSNAKDIDKKDLIKIIDSVKFFNFKSTNIGLSYPLYGIFICGINDNNETKPLEWIRYYVRLLIIFMHEILDHIIVFLIRALYDENIKYPEIKGNIFSRTAYKRGRESGEYLHVKLFGKLLKQLTINELCFIFDINNYSCDHQKFTENFLECNKKKEYKIPEILADLLKNVKMNESDVISLGIYATKGDNQFTFNIIDENENLCKIIDFDIFEEDDLKI